MLNHPSALEVAEPVPEIPVPVLSGAFVPVVCFPATLTAAQMTLGEFHTTGNLRGPYRPARYRKRLRDG